MLFLFSLSVVLTAGFVLWACTLQKPYSKFTLRFGALLLAITLTAWALFIINGLYKAWMISFGG